MRTGLRRGTRTLILGLLLFTMLINGCNEGSDFDPDLLFTLEDYANDTNYAGVYIDMMNRWHTSMTTAKSHLAANVSGIPFVEAVPSGWRPITDSQLLHEELGFDDDWYFASFQDAIYEIIRFDYQVPASAPVSPARVDYGRVRYQRDPLGGTHLNGDVVTLSYTDNYSNVSRAEGVANYGSLRVLYFTRAGSSVQNFPAAMVNQWNAEVTDVSTLPHNPSATFEVTGQTIILRVDTQDQVVLPIRATTVLRSNGRGEASIRVNNVERARIYFESLDTSFHGYVSTLDSGFRERIAF